MDTRTGIIHEFADAKEREAFMAFHNDNPTQPHIIPLKRHPKPNCKKCHGRGHVGYNAATKSYVVCKCVL